MRRILISLGAVFALLRALGAEDLQPGEYQIKAAFVFNFAKFVDWPAAAFSNENGPFYIGVLGDDPFDKDLELTVSGKQINNHKLVVKRFGSGKKPEFCHILFVSRSERKDWPQILEALKGQPVLTVGDGIEKFGQQGGMINLIMVGKKVRFEINQPAAEKARLKIGSRLLKLGQGSENAQPSN